MNNNIMVVQLLKLVTHDATSWLGNRVVCYTR